MLQKKLSKFINKEEAVMNRELFQKHFKRDLLRAKSKRKIKS